MEGSSSPLGPGGLWAPPQWLLRGDARLHPSWTSLMQTMRSKDAVTMQARGVAEKLVELGGAQVPANAAGFGRGRGAPGGAAASKARKSTNRIKTSVQEHIAALEEIQADMSRCWRSFELEVQRGVQAAHQQVDSRAQVLLSTSSHAYHRRLSQMDSQKRFMVSKLQQLRRGAAPTTPAEVASEAAAWDDPPGATCWEYGAAGAEQGGGASAASTPAFPWDPSRPHPTYPILPQHTPPAGGSAQSAAEAGRMLGEIASLRNQLAIAHRQLDDARRAAPEGAQGEEALRAKIAKLEEAKKVFDRKLRSTDRERQEKNEEVSRLHLQLRGAVDGIKKKTEDFKRVSKELETVKSRLDQLQKEHDSKVLDLETQLRNRDPSAQEMCKSSAGGSQSDPKMLVIPRLTLACSPPRAVPHAQVIHADCDMGVLQKVKEQRAREMAGAGMEAELPGVGGIPPAPDAPARDSLPSGSQVTAVVSATSTSTSSFSFAPVIRNSASPATSSPTSAGAASAATPPPGSAEREEQGAGQAGGQVLERHDSASSGAPPPAPGERASSPKKHCALRVCPSFRNSALLPFSVLGPHEEETMDFDMEHIAEKGSRSSAFLSATQILVDVLTSEMAAAMAYEKEAGGVGGSAEDLKQLLQMKMTVHERMQQGRAKSTPQLDASGPQQHHQPNRDAGGGKPRDESERAAQKKALEDLLSKLERSVELQRGRHAHLRESVPMLASVLSQIGGSNSLAVGGVDPPTLPPQITDLSSMAPALADMMVQTAIAEYSAWQKDFLETCKPTMDVTDALLVQLYDSILAEKRALHQHGAKVRAGVVQARHLLATAEAVWRRLWDEQESRAREHTCTLLAEGREVLQQMEMDTSAQQEVVRLKKELEQVVEGLLQVREMEIRMNAELQLLSLRGTDEQSMDKASRRVAKNAEKVASLRERQQVIVTRLAESGVSDEELKLATNEATVSIALRQRQLRVFVEGRSLCDYSDLQPVPSCARGNLSTARLGQEPCVVKSVPGITAANRNEFQQVVVGMRRLEHPCLARMQSVFFSDSHAYLHLQVPERIVTMDAWLKQQTRKTYEVCEVFSQLIGCCAYLHRHGVVVRTLALTSVFVANDRSPVLLDVEGSSSQPLSASATMNASASGRRSVAAPEPAPASTAPPPSSSFMAMSLSAMGGQGRPDKPQPQPSASEPQEPAARTAVVPAGMHWARKVPSPPKPTAPEEAAWGEFVGVKEYQAPEVQQGEAPTAVSDLWAVGMMMFHAVFRDAVPVPDSDKGHVVIPAHEDECLRALLAALLRTDPRRRLQTADQVLAHAFFATDVLGRDGSASHQIVQTEWKIKLLREYGQRLQAGRPPVPIEISMLNLVDSTLGTFVHLPKGTLVQPLHVTFVNASSALASQQMPTMSSLYTSFFAQVLHSPHNLFETCRGAAFLPCSTSTLSMLTQTGLAVDVFELIGRILVKCLIDGYSVPPVLAPSLFKYLLDVEPSLEDLDPFHPQLASALRTIMEINFNSASAIEQAAQIRCQVEALVGSSFKCVSAALTNQAQCVEFTRMITSEVLVCSRKSQLEAFKAGFNVVDLSCYLPVFSPRDLICVFTSPSLERGSNTGYVEAQNRAR